jgi:ribosomal protein L11
MAEAKSTGINKSEEIRKLAKQMKETGEKPRPVVIVATLRQRGIDVSSPQVSMVLKKMGYRPSKRKKALSASNGPVALGARANTIVAREGVVSIDDILAAKKVASLLGGTDRALAALTALKRIQS